MEARASARGPDPEELTAAQLPGLAAVLVDRPGRAPLALCWVGAEAAAVDPEEQGE